MEKIEEVITKFEGRGFEHIELIPGSTFCDNSTVLVIPTRGMIHSKVVSYLLMLAAPMNQPRSILFASGHEVGRAYNALIEKILANPVLSKYKYIMTIEDDNLPPPDAHIKLLESIEWGKYDAVSGIYFTKGDYGMPMAFGDPEEYSKTGVLNFKPRKVSEGIKNGNIMPVNGIAMGCALWRLDLFRQIPKPWFVTVNEFQPGVGVSNITQDLWFCANAKRAGKKFAVDLRVRVGHLDINTDIVY